MITTSDVIQFLHALETNDIPKAKDHVAAFPEPDNAFEKGYHTALGGMLSSAENNEKDSLLYKILHNELSAESVQAQRERCSLRARESFRNQDERGYEQAWEHVCAYFLNDLKSGLDAYQ